MGQNGGFLARSGVHSGMRIAVVVERTSHYRETDGVCRLERVARGLADQDHDVRVFCAQWWDGYEITRVAEGLTYHGVTVSPASSSFVARLPVLLARFRPDVVHATPTPATVVRAAWLGSTLARAPLLIDWYGDESSDSRLGPAVRAPDRIVTPSRLVQRKVRERGAAPDRTRVIPEAVDMDLIRRTDPSGDADVVYARRLDAEANLESLLLALAQHRQRGWSATVVGDGPEREGYEAKAADLRIDDRVEFVGVCDREERVARYRGSHAFVHTAQRTCFATELLWALACGCVGVVEYQEDSSAHELVEERSRGLRATGPEEVEEELLAAESLERRTVDEEFAEYDRNAILDMYLACYRDTDRGA